MLILHAISCLQELRRLEIQPLKLAWRDSLKFIFIYKLTSKNILVWLIWSLYSEIDQPWPWFLELAEKSLQFSCGLPKAISIKLLFPNE